MRDNDHEMSMRLPEELYERLRKVSFDQRVPMSRLIRQALEQLLDSLEMQPAIMNARDG